MRKRRASACVDTIRGLLTYASAIGADLEGIYEITGLDPKVLESTETRISIEQFNAVWREIARRAEDRDFGLHCAEAAYGIPTGNVISIVMMNCPTVGSAMEKLSRYHDLATDFVQLRLKQQDDRAYLSWKPIYPDMPLDRHHSEAVLTLLSFTLRDLTRGQVRFVEVRFVHSEQSAFNHAFKRWTGSSPREYRNRGPSPVPLE